MASLHGFGGQKLNNAVNSIIQDILILDPSDAPYGIGLHNFYYKIVTSELLTKYKTNQIEVLLFLIISYIRTIWYSNSSNPLH